MSNNSQNLVCRLSLPVRFVLNFMIYQLYIQCLFKISIAQYNKFSTQHGGRNDFCFSLELFLFKKKKKKIVFPLKQSPGTLLLLLLNMSCFPGDGYEFIHM